MRTVFIMILGLFFGSCEQDTCRETTVKKVELNIKVERLEKELFSCQSKMDVQKFLSENKTMARYFLDADEYPHDSILAARLFGLVTNEFIDTLYQETMEVYSDFQVQQQILEEAVGRMKTLFPDMNVPKIQTMVTGLYNDLIISDSLIVVGLDYFIGEGASYKPKDIPGYILSRYDAEHLPITIVKFLSGNRVQKGGKETLLSEMIDFGKAYYLMGQLMPCVPDSLIMGYTPKEMIAVKDNEAIIWANFVENKILYETSHLVKRKFLGERPNVYEISRDCPGRIAAWVGWQIVNDFMSSQQVSVLDLINEKDNDKILRLSGYKPKN